MKIEQRIDYLDIAKAICIVLVVVGHFNPSLAPEGWHTSVDVIYTFHMPLFMFVSGFLFTKTYKQQPYLNFISKKFRQLMIPYFLTSIIIIGIKLTLQSILPVKNTVMVQDFLTMFYMPSTAVHLWFIWALMLLYLIAPLCRKKALAFLSQQQYGYCRQTSQAYFRSTSLGQMQFSL